MRTDVKGLKHKVKDKIVFVLLAGSILLSVASMAQNAKLRAEVSQSNAKIQTKIDDAENRLGRWIGDEHDYTKEQISWLRGESDAYLQEVLGKALGEEEASQAIDAAELDNVYREYRSEIFDLEEIARKATGTKKAEKAIESIKECDARYELICLYTYAEKLTVADAVCRVDIDVGKFFINDQKDTSFQAFLDHYSKSR
jgi:hypothetical protein